MKLKPLLLSVALAALATSSAFAHRFWIIPSTSVLSGTAPWVSFDAAVSNDLFFANHHAPQLESITAIDPDGSLVELQNGKVAKYRTTFDLQLTKPGTYRIATVRGGYFASWEEGGERKRWRGPAERLSEVKDKPGLELTETASRVETFVTSGQTSIPKASGKGLELVFDKAHPNDLFAAEPAVFTLHHDGKPAVGAEVTVIKGDDRYRTQPGEIKIKTGPDGTFTVKWPEAGRFWLEVSAEGAPQEVGGVPAKRRASYTATFEVLPQ